MANVNNGLTNKNNQLQKKTPTPIDAIRGMLEQPNIKSKFESMLGKKAAGFMASIINVYSNNNLIGKDPMSIISAAAVAATLDLPIDPNLGQAWIVPYGDKAQFQMATRGYVQLAQRSSQYKRINTVVIYANQFKSWNSLTEELDADFTVEGEGATVGYAAYFKLINGFEKLVYWSKSKVLAHAKKFSKTYNKKEDRFASWNKYKKQWIPSPWESDFDAMALKTVLKTALKNWGVLSIEMQTALTADQAIVKEEVLKGGDISNNVEYVDNPESESSDEAHDAEFTEENKDEPENKEKDIYEGTPFGDESK